MSVSRETLLPEVRFAQMFHVKHLKRRDLNVSRETFLYTEGIQLYRSEHARGSFETPSGVGYRGQ